MRQENSGVTDAATPNGAQRLSVAQDGRFHFPPSKST